MRVWGLGFGLPGAGWGFRLYDLCRAYQKKHEGAWKEYRFRV